MHVKKLVFYSITTTDRSNIHLVPIDFSYMTSYRLPTVTFALGRTVYPQNNPYSRQTEDATL